MTSRRSLADNGAFPLVGALALLSLPAALSRRRGGATHLAVGQQVKLSQTGLGTHPVGTGWRGQVSEVFPDGYRVRSADDERWWSDRDLVAADSTERIWPGDHYQGRTPAGSRKRRSGARYTLTTTPKPPEQGKWTLTVHRSASKNGSRRVTQWFLNNPQGGGGGNRFTGSVAAAVAKAVSATKRGLLPERLRVMVIDDVSKGPWQEFYVNTSTLEQVK